MRVDQDAVASAAEGPAASTPADRRRFRLPRGRARRWAEPLASLLLGLPVLLVHDVGYVLHQPFWTDEAWVAASTIFPFSQLPAMTSSTPIGWAAAAHLITVPGTQVARVLPLAFAGAAVVAGYWFARSLGWRDRAEAVGAGLLAACCVLLVPAMLIRNDLKQYTSDAFFALLALILTSRLERNWSRRGLAALSVCIWGGMLFSHTVAFAGGAALAVLGVLQVVRRAWPRLLEWAVTAVVTGALMLGVYQAFDARAVAPLAASKYWPLFYLPLHSGLHASAAFVVNHLRAAWSSFGLGPAWLAIPLVLAGLVTIGRLGRPATAITVAALWPEMLLLSALHKYPFLDRRTSTFLFVVTAVVAAVGVAGLAALARRWLRGAIAVTLALAAAVAFAVGARPYVRIHSIPAEDVRDQALNVAHHAAPNDVILVNLSSNWGFGYYWPVGHPSRRPSRADKQEYELYYPGQPRIVVARDRTPAAVSAALAQAVTLAQHRSCARIWLIRSHVSSSEQAAWLAAFGQHDISRHRVGIHGLKLIQLLNCHPAAG